MFKSSVLITLLSLAATVFGFLTQLLIAEKFGASVEVDIYIIALSGPVFTAGMVGMLFNLTVTSEVSKLSSRDQDVLILKICLPTLVFSILIMLLSPLFVELQISMLPSTVRSEYISQYKNYFYASWGICSLQICLFLAASILTGLNKPVTATALAILPYLGSFLNLYVAADNTLLAAIYGNLYGIIISLILSLFIIKPPLCKIDYRIKWINFKVLLGESVAILVGMMCFSIYAIIDSFWAPQSGTGVLSVLSYMHKIIIGFGNLAISGPSLLIIPLFSKIISEKKYNEYKIQIARLIYSAGLVILILSGLLYKFSNELVSVLFFRGNFTELNVLAVSESIKFALPGMVAMLFSVLLNRLLFCFNGVAFYTAGLGLFWAVAYFIWSSFLYKYGYIGISIAYSLTWLMYLSLLIYSIKKITIKAFND